MRPGSLRPVSPYWTCGFHLMRSTTFRKEPRQRSLGRNRTAGALSLLGRRWCAHLNPPRIAMAACVWGVALHAGEFRWIREASVRHHLSQSDHPRFREEKPGDRRRCFKAHQAALNQTLGRRWQLRLALSWSTSPGSELKALGYGGQGAEELVQLTADVLAFAGRECTDGRLDGFGHGGIIACCGRCVRAARTMAADCAEGARRCSKLFCFGCRIRPVAAASNAQVFQGRKP